MGYFPYNCQICGGAYNRCGYSKHKNCPGGQFCFEEKVVVNINNKIIKKCKYDGYGRIFDSDDKLYIPNDLLEFFSDYEKNLLEYNWKESYVVVYCASCYKKRYN